MPKPSSISTLLALTSLSLLLGGCEIIASVDRSKIPADEGASGAGQAGSAGKAGSAGASGAAGDRKSVV